MVEILQMAKTNILLIEDSAADAEIVRSQLEDVSGYHVEHASDIATALLMLGQCAYNAALLDLSLPDNRDLEGFHALQNMAPNLPIVILTGRDDEALALKAVESGAQDYLVKDRSRSSTLKIAISYAIQRKRFEDNITQQANFDSLTGLANRILFEHKLEAAVARIQRSGHGLGVLFLDLDDFKNVNDTLGHAAGDLLLKEVGSRMKQCVRPYDTVARMGGDEFAILIEDIKESHDCAAVAQKLIDAVSKPVTLDSRRVTVGVSIGVATCAPIDNAAPSLLMDQADTAMYRAKDEKDSCYRFYTEDMDEALRLRMQMEGELGEAVQKDQLTLCYQPKQSLETGGMMGVEALVRWDHPRLGTLLPGEFLGFSREIHMLEEIEGWVLEQVCRDMALWKGSDLPTMHVSVNVSSSRFDSPDFLRQLVTLLERYKIEPRLLTLELPEEVFAPRSLNRAQTFAKLYRLGVGITIDKFGGSVSSLRSLRNAVLSELKLDGRFSQGAISEDARLVKAIVACAHTLGIKVVASGVETEELRAVLKQHHCDAIQGFVYSRPMPRIYLEDWLRQQRKALEIIRKDYRAANDRNG